MSASSNVTTATGRRPRVFFGWWIVGAAALINVYGAGIWFYGFPVLFKALLDEFGWGRAVAAGAIAFSRLEGGLEAPIVGWLVDKFGPRKLAIVGAVIAGVGFIIMGQIRDLSLGPVTVSALVLFYLLYGGVISIGYNTGFGHATMACVANWFVKKRSRAFAIYSLGAGGSGFTVMLLGWAVASFGWRTAVVLSGLGIFIIVIPLSLLLRHKPEQYGYLPDGDDPQAGRSPVGAAAGSLQGQSATPDHDDPPAESQTSFGEYNFSVRQTLRTMGFWMLVVGLTGRSITMTSVVVHEVAYLTDIGIPLAQASTALGAMVSISLIGRMVFGGFGDYVDKRLIFAGSFLLQAVGIFLLDRVTSMTDVWVFAVVYGIAYGGAIPIQFAIVADYFGRRNYATIRGFMQMFLLPATVLGPIYAGWVFDVTASYHTAFMSFIGALLISVVFIMMARRPVPPVATAVPSVS